MASVQPIAVPWQQELQQHQVANRAGSIYVTPPGFPQSGVSGACTNKVPQVVDALRKAEILRWKNL